MSGYLPPGDLPAPRNLAYRLLARGLSVIPVPRPGPGLDGKTPLIKWREYQTRLPTYDELNVWFNDEPMNFAVITGAVSGVVVVDVDTHEAGYVALHLPATPWRTVTAKGEHHWYQHPGGLVANRVRLQTDDGRLPVDVRGDGGFVIAPSSVHASGVVYEAVGDWSVPRTQLPVFSPDWLPRPARSARVTNQEPRRETHTDAAVRARAYLAKVPTPEIGFGSDLATFVAACHVARGFALDAVEAEQVLWEWCGGRVGWTREWVAQKVSSALAHGKEPIGGLLR